jgi:hypothetical protein
MSGTLESSVAYSCIGVLVALAVGIGLYRARQVK